MARVPPPASGFTLSAARTIAGTYKTQYQLMFASSGLGADATGTLVTVNGTPQTVPSYQAYFDSGSTVTYNYNPTVTSSVSGKQYMLMTPAPTPASGFTVSAALTIAGTYKTQFQLMFASSGLGADATGTLVTVNGTPQTVPSYQAYFDSGSTVTYSYNPTVTSTVSGKQYVLTTPAPTPASA